MHIWINETTEELTHQIHIVVYSSTTCYAKQQDLGHCYLISYNTQHSQLLHITLCPAPRVSKQKHFILTAICCIGICFAVLHYLYWSITVISTDQSHGLALVSYKWPCTDTRLTNTVIWNWLASPVWNWQKCQRYKFPSKHNISDTTAQDSQT